jgi:hypothetical protein
MAPTPELWKLPAALRTYTVRYLPSDSTICGQECFVCYRNFGEKDDPDDPRELVCQPVELLPCKHVVGSECFKKVLGVGMDTCQLCRTKIRIATDPVPRWLQYMASSQWFTFQIDASRSLLPKLGQRYDHLCEKLFSGSLDLPAACTLWCHCMISPVASMANLCLLACLMQIFCFPFVWLEGGNSRFEILGVGIGMVFTIILAITRVWPARLRYNEVLVGLSLRLITLVVGWTGFIALLLAHCSVYALISGMLIAYGFLVRSDSG